MASAIILIDKDIKQAKLKGQTVTFYGLSLDLQDTGVSIPCTFLQTDSCVQQFVGVTPMGLVILNSGNTDLSSGTDLTITASPRDGSSDVSVSLTAAELVATSVGSALS